MCGPTGIGVLWGRRKLLEKLSPYQYGGDMILQVKDQLTTWNELPWKFEAGTPNYGDSIAFGTALDYLESLGMGRIYAYEHQLVEYARRSLEEISGVEVLATKQKDSHSGVVSFVCDEVHPHDVATYLDAEGVAIRAGHHCAQPLMTKLGLPATNRISFSFYNTKEEVDRMAKILSSALEFFRKG
ncbi:MAG: aminotransferase class V-fold PLP-dependent enzyme [Oligoflexia bacterium]|nr:aminotransferase class V-fold PLP-dependent enzyme [Oligoflexia bacterium]